MTDKILIEPTTVMFPMATTDAKITDHKRTALRALLVPCILIVILCTSLYLYMRPLGSHDAQTTSVFMNHASQMAKPTIDQRDRIKQELKKKLPPLLSDLHSADQAALTRLHQNIQADFAMYRKNIPVFIDHSSIATRRASSSSAPSWHTIAIGNLKESLSLHSIPRRNKHCIRFGF